MRVGFGDCVFDSDTREVFRGGNAAPLSPKAFVLLDLLIRNRPKAVSKESIHRQLWPATFVSDASLGNIVAEIREAIGDDAHEPRFIRTVHRFGYAFSGRADEGARPPWPAGSPKFAYRLIWGPREIALEEGETILGRDPEAVPFIDHTGVSRRHARVMISGDTATIEDLDSKNGSFVRGERIHAVSPLADGDEIVLGSVRMTFRILPISGSTETVDERQ